MATPTATDAGKALIIDAWGDALNSGIVKFKTAGGAESARVTLNSDAFPGASGTGTVSAEANKSPALIDSDADGQAAADTTLVDVCTSLDEKLFSVAVTAQRIYSGNVVTITSLLMSM